MTSEAQETAGQRVLAGLVRLSLALKSRAWQARGRHGLTPTQGQILVLLHQQGRDLRLAEVAAALAVQPATASEAVQALVRKGLVQKRRARGDARAVALTLTPAGQRLAAAVADWPDVLLAAVETLSPEEQAVFLRALSKMIRTLQVRGQIPVARLCVTCRFFRPYVYADPQRPHHCAFVDAPFGDGALRLDCPDHQAATPHEAARLWQAFVAGGQAP
ncbi:MAG: MarR family transcriptional regulator [Candidatus Tectimicrobiota bacterium]|nr:MAG: MarR family transcriptional regulator [Candidatus Tectomicrobia bacterium]